MGVRSFAVRSLRARLTITAVGIVALTLMSGALGLVAILRSSLEHGVTNTALTRAADVASLAKAGTLPPSLAFPGEERSIIQVIDAKGSVVASTANLAGEPALALRSSAPYTASGLPVGDNRRFRITTTPVDISAGRVVVVSGESLERVDETVRTVELALVAGLPVLLVIVAALAWSGTRRALRPVESIRAEVSEITESGLHRRVPEPDGNDEIAHLARTMNAMLDRLAAASERQARFVSDASHELRSPLTSLKALLEIGLARPDRQDWPDRIAGALVEVDRLENLVRDLLVLGRTENGEATTTTFDLAAIVNWEVVRMGSPGRVAVSATGDRRLWVQGNADQLSRVFANILANGVRHARSTVGVAMKVDGANVVVEVADDGAGIPPADHERVFERFVRLDEARTAGDGGSGLGLAIVRTIVNSHAGTVTVVDEGPGTTIRVVLPQASPPAGVESLGAPRRATLPRPGR